MTTTARTVLVVVVAALLFLTAATALLLRLNSLAEANRENGEYIIECTTAGPHPPPDTGHPCFDDGQKRTAAAVAQIVDVNGNGIPDVLELAESVGHPLPTTTLRSEP